VIIKSNNNITKNDDPSQTEVMKGKGRCATATTSAVFELLKNVGIPVAYKQRLSKSRFLAERCDMILLEVIGRRYAVGSFLKRSPNLVVPKGQPPHRFHSWKFEMFLKTTGLKIRNKKGKSLGKIPVDDPFIPYPYAKEWSLHQPKIPLWDEESSLGKKIKASSILPKGVRVEEIEKILKQVALVLEGAFSQIGIRFIDFKIEFGITTKGELVVADVIDNDSWRARDSNWDELSKQLFRDNAAKKLIKDKYSLVAKLVQSFKIPNQALVLWRGSPSDDFPEVPAIAGVKVVKITLSGHKSPQKCLVRLEQTLAEYPEGGVVIPIVGMSNGLGPTIAARTSWPVIAIPATAKSRPHDVWSSLESPSDVPLMTVLSPKNAILSALNILSQKNPAAYMTRQLVIEELDD
jgi:phosphoribosylaminoimidazole carboxylase/phosphoribosylaminoimidazole-succinocarboxamide synthase